MAGKLKLIFADFLRTLRQLWLEFIGGIFLALGVLFVLAAIQEYRKYIRSPELGTGRFLMVLLSSIVMLFFALESSWKKSMKMEERSTIRNRPVPNSGLRMYFRYSCIAARTKSTPSARKIPPMNSNQSWRRVLRKSAKISLSFPMMEGMRHLNGYKRAHQ